MHHHMYHVSSFFPYLIKIHSKCPALVYRIARQFSPVTSFKPDGLLATGFAFFDRNTKPAPRAALVTGLPTTNSIVITPLFVLCFFGRCISNSDNVFEKLFIESKLPLASEICRASTSTSTMLCIMRDDLMHHYTHAVLPTVDAYFTPIC